MLCSEPSEVNANKERKEYVDTASKFRCLGSNYDTILLSIIFSFQPLNRRKVITAVTVSVVGPSASTGLSVPFYARSVALDVRR